MYITYVTSSQTFRAHKHSYQMDNYQTQFLKVYNNNYIKVINLVYISGRNNLIDMNII